MKLSRSNARKRSIQGWQTRRRNNPSRYGNVSKTRGKTYWKRPNGQKVRLKGFSPTEIEQIKPALITADTTLRARIRPQVDVIQKKRRVGDNLALYEKTTFGKPKIKLGDKAFKRTNPAGILSHEIGHSIYPGVSSSRNRSRQFRKDFGYRKKALHSERDVSKYSRTKSNKIPKKHTRQSENAAEDFAETYRAATGQRVSNRRYWRDVKVDAGRQRHLYEHYLR